MGGVNRSTSIDLQSIERDVATLAGRAATTPISMKALYDEVQNLKGNFKKVTVFDLSKIPAQSVKNGLNLNISSYLNHPITSTTLVAVNGNFTIYNGWDGTGSNKNCNFNGGNFECIAKFGAHNFYGGVKVINKIPYLWCNVDSTYNIMMKQTGQVVLIDL